MPSATKGAAGAGERQRGGRGHGRTFVNDWVAEVERQTKRQVRRVLANPTAHHALHHRVLRAGQVGARQARQVRRQRRRPASSSWSSWASSKQLDANDQGVMQVVDWLWQYAFDQRASDIHLEPRREQGVIRFRIDGVLHPSTRCPWACWNAMIARQAARPHGRGRKAPPAGRPHQDAQPAATRWKCACPPCPPPSARRW